jgi:1,4-dihydroxy-2-naphthoate octaprenyltransferase
MTKNISSSETVEETTFVPKILGLIKATRPQFLIAYLIISFGALTQGEVNNFTIDPVIALFSIFLTLLSAIGVHYRDEASDWAAGYDKEIGGMGVIRDGILEENTIRKIGWSISGLTIVLGILQALILYITYNDITLFIIGFPIFIMIILVNFLTEEIPLGHEVITAGSYFATFYWVFFAQHWTITPSVFFFSLFLYLVVFALVPYQDIGDYEADKKTGKKTLVVKLGLDELGHLAIFVGLSALIFLYVSMTI